MSRLAYNLVVVGGGLFLLAVVYGIGLLPSGERSMAELTNVHGIPFAPVDDFIVVTQALAHMDVYLREPVSFKKLVLTFEYVPLDSQVLAVGVRENDFWLSYTPTTFYEVTTTANSEAMVATIAVPLTDKLQDIDRSIDVMFIANGQTEASLTNEVADATVWKIRNIKAQVAWQWPTGAQFKDYVRSIITRERPL